MEFIPIVIVVYVSNFYRFLKEIIRRTKCQLPNRWNISCRFILLPRQMAVTQFHIAFKTIAIFVLLWSYFAFELFFSRSLVSRFDFDSTSNKCYRIISAISFVLIGLLIIHLDHYIYILDAFFDDVFICHKIQKRSFHTLNIQSIRRNFEQMFHCN